MSYSTHAPIPNTENAIVRPVMYKLMQDLMEEGMLPCIKKIEFNETIGKRRLNGTTLCNKGARLGCEEYIIINATPSYRLDDDQWNRNMPLHRQPIWNDGNHGLSVTPTYDFVTVEMEIHVVSQSMSKLRQWQQNVRIRQRNGRQRVTHRIQYQMLLILF